MARPPQPPPVTHVVSGSWPRAELDEDVAARYCQDLAAALSKRLTALGWSYRELERKSGVSHRAAAAIAQGLAAPDLRTIARLELALEVDLLSWRSRTAARQAASQGDSRG